MCGWLWEKYSEQPGMDRADTMHVKSGSRHSALCVSVRVNSKKKLLPSSSHNVWRFLTNILHYGMEIVHYWQRLQETITFFNFGWLFLKAIVDRKRKMGGLMEEKISVFTNMTDAIKEVATSTRESQSINVHPPRAVHRHHKPRWLQRWGSNGCSEPSAGRGGATLWQNPTMARPTKHQIVKIKGPIAANILRSTLIWPVWLA